MGGIGIWQLLIVLLLVVLLFGTRRLKTLGADLGETIKGFRNSVSDIKGDDTLAHHNSLNDASRNAHQQTEHKH